MIYLAYQLNMKNINDSVSIALQRYVDRFGLPPNIIETGMQEVPLPEGMEIVVRSVRIPKNLILIGRETNEPSQMGLEVEAEQE